LEPNSAFGTAGTWCWKLHGGRTQEGKKGRRREQRGERDFVQKGKEARKKRKIRQVQGRVYTLRRGVVLPGHEDKRKV